MSPNRLNMKLSSSFLTEIILLSGKRSVIDLIKDLHFLLGTPKLFDTEEITTLILIS
jgi:hypothetical protein